MKASKARVVGSMGSARIALALAAAACGGEGNEARSANALGIAGSAGTAAPSADLPASSVQTPSVGAIDANGELLLDELDDSDALFAAGAVSGEWFTYSDGTSPITPPDHSGIASVAGEAHVSGSGFSDWGAGLSAYFRSVDLTAFDGFRLRAHGTGSIVVELATPATSPAAEGGTCVSGCFGHFATSITLGPDSQDYDISFAQLAQPTWASPAQLALDGVISLNLVVKGSAASPAAIDLWVERLALHAIP